MSTRFSPRRPTLLVVSAVVLTAAAVSMPLQIVVEYGHTWDEWRSVLTKLTYLNRGVIALCLLNAYLLRDARGLCRLTVPALIVAVAVNNWSYAQLAPHATAWTAVLSAAALAAIFAPLLLPTYRHLFAEPHRRAWLQSPRTRMKLPSLLTFSPGAEVSARTWDLSKSGVFFELERDEAPNDPEEQMPFAVGDSVIVSLPAVRSPRSQLQLRGRVVRKAVAPRGAYPSGFAVHFERIDWFARRKLALMLAHCEQASVAAF